MDSGAMTQQEYEQQRKKILNQTKCNDRSRIHERHSRPDFHRDKLQGGIHDKPGFRVKPGMTNQDKAYVVICNARGFARERI